MPLLKKSIGSLAVGVLLLLVAPLLEFAAAPHGVPVAVFYAIPMLVVARFSSAGPTALFVVLVYAVYLVSSLWRGVDWDFTLPGMAALGVIGYLAYLASSRLDSIRQAHSDAEHALSRAEETRGRLQEFMAMVAHDLANPITTVLGLSRALSRPDLSEDDRDYALRTIPAEAARMEVLTRDLQIASRAGHGRLSLEPELIDLVGLTRWVVEEQQRQSPAHEFRLQAPPSLAGQWDRALLQRVLVNLVNNAVKYTPEAGTITITVEQHDPDQALWSIADQGVGFAREEQTKLFTQFSRLDSSGNVGGMGLALFIVKTIVEAHGGTIRGQSGGRGCGALFSFTLPRASVAGRRESQPLDGVGATF